MKKDGYTRFNQGNWIKFGKICRRHILSGGASKVEKNLYSLYNTNGGNRYG